MYKNTKVAVVIPAYNEELLIKRTIDELPSSVDYLIAVNDASTDSTPEILHDLQRHAPRLHVLDNTKNGGVGFSLKRGFMYALEHTDAEAIGIVSGDSQCDPNSIEPMLDEFLERPVEYVKGSRFFQREALTSMPSYRRLGNIVVSLLTKFATGYYSVSDTTMGFGFLRRRTLQQIHMDLVGDRYDYETSMLVALSIAEARIRDFPVPAIYGEETSTINFWGTLLRVLRVLWVGFWRRVYYKYVLFSFHPIALFLLGGFVFTSIGVGFGIYMAVEKAATGLSPSTGTVMLCALPLILGFQMLLTALMMDTANESKP
jgi:glycosyltransferase involved in cell wall biosynthesis